MVSLARPLAVLTLPVSSILSGCGEGDAVARVDDEPITAADLREFVDNLPSGLKSPDRGADARRQYLQSLIDRRLLLIEARSRGLPEDPAIAGLADRTIRSRLMTMYQRAVVAPRVQIHESDLRQRFADLGLQRQRRLNAILVRTREEIDAISARLRRGASFEELAREHSLDRRSAANGGELGFIDAEAAQRIHVPRDVFLELPTGQVSEPMAAGTSWHLVRFTEERASDLADYRQRLQDELFAVGLRRAEAEEIETLRARYGVSLLDEGFSHLLEAYRLRQTAGLDTSSLGLYAGQDLAITVGEAQKALLGRVKVLSPPARAKVILEQTVLRPLLFERAAREQELVEASELEHRHRRLLEDALLEALRRQETAGTREVSEIEVRQYYDDHPELFVHERSVWAEELLLASQAEAHQALRLIEEGADFAELASRSLRPEAAQRGARHHYHPHESALYPRLLPALMEAEAGALTGPAEVEGGWSIFRVAHFDEGGLEPFERAARRARALLVRKRQQEVFRAFLQSLRESYGDRVQIYAERLDEALPDQVM